MKTKQAIANVIESLYAGGKDSKKIAQRLIEAGIRMMWAERDLGPDRRIVPSKDGSFFVSVITERVREPAQLDSWFLSPDDTREACKGLLKILAENEDVEVCSLSLEGETRIHAIYLTALGYLIVDDLTDVISVTTKGRDFIGLRPEGVLDLPVTVAELTENTPESELAARYMEGKVAAIDIALAKHQAPMYSQQMTWKEAYQAAALTLKAAADEFRQGLHIPPPHTEFRVIGYNEDRSTGVSHATSLQTFFYDVHARNVKAGWWTDLATGEPKKRSVGEMFMLMVTEIAEAYEAYKDDAADDKLPEYRGLGVELGDLGIRWADFCGALMAGRIVDHSLIYNPGDRMFQEVCDIANRYEAIRKTPEANGDPEVGDFLPPMDVGLMVDAKLAYNAKREDHKIENRIKEGGKKT